MLIQHQLPPGWEDTDEPGKIQPSAVVGLAHVLTMEPGDIEALRGPEGPRGPQGPQGDAGVVVFGGGVGTISVVLVSVSLGAFQEFMADGSLAYRFAASLASASGVAVPAGQVWRSMMSAEKSSAGAYVLAQRVS